VQMYIETAYFCKEGRLDDAGGLFDARELAAASHIETRTCEFLNGLALSMGPGMA
jgi:hypothetical protein